MRKKMKAGFDFNLSFKVESTLITQNFPISYTKIINSGIIHKLWASEEIKKRKFKVSRNDLANIAVKYSILTPYTSLICVLNEESLPIELLRTKQVKEINNLIPVDYLSLLYVKTLTGKAFSIEISGDALVEDLKEIIFDKEGIPAVQQRIVYAGQQLEDWRTLSSYNIGDESTCYLILRLRGGGYARSCAVIYNGVFSHNFFFSDESMTVEDIKKEILSKLNIDKAAFVSNDQELKDKDTCKVIGSDLYVYSESSKCHGFASTNFR